MLSLQLGNDWFGERPGGLNRVFFELIKHLPAEGVDVVGLVAGGSSIEIETRGAVRGFAGRTAPLWERLWKVRKEAESIVRERQPDLVGVHFALYASAVLDRLRGRPSVIHFHGPWAAEGGVEGSRSIISKIQSSLERRVYRHGKRFVVLSHAFREELVRRYAVPDELVRVVPGGIDVHRFNMEVSRAQARASLGWPTGRPIVLTVRRQMRRMGLEVLLNALETVKKRVPDVLLMLAGSGSLSHELSRTIECMGLSGNAQMLGRVDDSLLPLAYRAADLSIVPTQVLEGFGMITLESLAAGTPVVVTPIGGLPEVVSPFAPQCVLDSATADSIASALSEFMLGSRPLPKPEDCRSYAVRRFAWPVIAKLTRDVYEEALR